jgi:carbon monoxide dehydrogenase subunit G
MDLKELDNGEVEIAYRMDVNMVGKLAMFGDRVMRSKATEVEKEFVKNLQAKLKTVA